MNQEEYNKRIKIMANKCMALNPEDPMAETWGVRDDSVTLGDAFMYPPRFHSGSHVSVDVTKTPGQNLDDNLDNSIDSDICDAIEEPYSYRIADKETGTVIAEISHKDLT